MESRRVVVASIFVTGWQQKHCYKVTAETLHWYRVTAETLLQGDSSIALVQGDSRNTWPQGDSRNIGTG